MSASPKLVQARRKKNGQVALTGSFASDSRARSAVNRGEPVAEITQKSMFSSENGARKRSTIDPLEKSKNPNGLHRPVKH